MMRLRIGNQTILTGCVLILLALCYLSVRQSVELPVDRQVEKIWRYFPTPCPCWMNGSHQKAKPLTKTCPLMRRRVSATKPKDNDGKR